MARLCFDFFKLIYLIQAQRRLAVAVTASASILLTLAHTAVSAAAGEVAVEQGSRRPISVTLSGGASLGSYQAGYLYYLSRFLTLNPSTFELKVVTGASAGSINGLLLILEQGSPGAKSSSPRDSLFWQTWIQTGFKELLDSENTESIFSADRLRSKADLFRDRWLKTDLRSEITFVVPVTPVNPTQELISAKTELKQQNRHFAITLRRSGTDGMTRVEPARYPSPFLQPILYTGASKEKNWESLRDLVIASSSYPLFFPPQRLKFCFSSRCENSFDKEEKFFDGGWEENRPLYLSHRFLNDPRALHFVIDTTGLSATEAKQEAKQEALKSSSEGDPVNSLLKGVLRRHQDKEILRLFELYPALLENTVWNQNSWPKASSGFWGFMGFLDQSFREYDFYLGVFEAHLSLQQYFRNNIGQDPISRFEFPEMSQRGNPDWDLFFCMKANYLNDPSYSEDCRKVDPHLIQVMKALSKATQEASQRDSQTETQSFHLAFLYYLGEEHYEFKDLGLKAEDADRAPSRIKTMFLNQINRINLPAGSRQTVKAALSTFVTDPKIPLESFWNFSLGQDVEAAYHFLFLDRTQTYLRLGLALSGAESVLDSQKTSVALAPFGGFEYRPQVLTSNSVQVGLSLLGGVFFSLQEDPSFGTCMTGSSRRTDCRNLFIEPQVTATYLESFRLALGVQFHLLSNNPQVPEDRLVWSLGLQF